MRRQNVLMTSKLALAIILVASLFMYGCQTQPMATATQPVAPSTQLPAPATQPGMTPPAKILKIGLVCYFGYPPGIDGLHGMNVMVDMINKNGGLSIGGDKYQVQLISYDSNNNQATAVSAVNRLINVDNVKFLMSDPNYVDAWLPITEANKIVVCAASLTPVILGPNNHYSFQSGLANFMGAVSMGWFAKTYPKLKTVAGSVPDNQMGHMLADMAKTTMDKFGMTFIPVYYPANTQDLSSIGTKVKELNPDVFQGGGDPISAGLSYKAVWQAGYRGHLWAGATSPAESMAQVASTEAIEGCIAGAWPVEFDPPPTQFAKDFKAAWIAKYGQWEGPEIATTANLACLVAALQQAGSLDTDKVVAVISNGLKFEGPTGAGQMVGRSDLGNNRTVDSLSSLPMKKIVGGKAQLIEIISLDDAINYFNAVYGSGH
jgi:branched-chain amino acid transport system substrate-binding protein